MAFGGMARSGLHISKVFLLALRLGHQGQDLRLQLLMLSFHELLLPLLILLILKLLLLAGSLLLEIEVRVNLDHVEPLVLFELVYDTLRHAMVRVHALN